ncbi:hypothetical protein B484DRAFT_410993, partial [Ochromonadaceae sp. CCMP2298]
MSTLLHPSPAEVRRILAHIAHIHSCGQVLVLIRGLPGMGKSTLGAQIAASLGTDGVQ